MNHYEIVKQLIDRKAVNFKAIGEFIAEQGPSLAFDDGPDICGTGRHFIHLIVLPGLGGYTLPNEGLRELAKIGSEIK